MSTPPKKLSKVDKLVKKLSPKKEEKPEKKCDKNDVTHEEDDETPVRTTVRSKDLSFKRLQLKDQILLRPDTYIGSVKKVRTSDNFWILEGDKFVQKSVNFTEGFLRLFIEVVSNAVDNVWRSHEFNTPSKFIKINIDKDLIEHILSSSYLAQNKFVILNKNMEKLIEKL